MSDEYKYIDSEWEKWGRQDPYFGVITSEDFRRDRMTEESRRRFFESGRAHAQYVLDVCRQRINSSFAPGRVLDFGCGVGRVTLPFAAFAQSVVGVDVSEAMLCEAERNRAEQALPNILFVRAEDGLANVAGSFDLIHSFIVFQHMEVDRGRRVFNTLIDRMAPGGIFVAHFTYGKSRYADNLGAPPAEERKLPSQWSNNGNDCDPLMLMNAYNVNELLFVMQRGGVRSFHTEFTDHGGELGVLLYFQR